MEEQKNDRADAGNQPCTDYRKAIFWTFQLLVPLSGKIKAFIFTKSGTLQKFAFHFWRTKDKNGGLLHVTNYRYLSFLAHLSAKWLPGAFCHYHTHTVRHFFFWCMSVMWLPYARHWARCHPEHKVVRTSSSLESDSPDLSGIWCSHTWLMVFSICTKPRLGSVFFMKSTMVSRFSCCRIKGLWLPKRLKATLNMTSDPWRKIISKKTQKCRVKSCQLLTKYRSLFSSSH